MNSLNSKYINTYFLYYNIISIFSHMYCIYHINQTDCRCLGQIEGTYSWYFRCWYTSYLVILPTRKQTISFTKLWKFSFLHTVSVEQSSKTHLDLVSIHFVSEKKIMNSTVFLIFASILIVWYLLNCKTIHLKTFVFRFSSECSSLLQMFIWL